MTRLRQEPRPPGHGYAKQTSRKRHWFLQSLGGVLPRYSPEIVLSWINCNGYFVALIEFHVMEKLWEAAHCFHAEGSVEAEQFVTRYLTMLLEGKVDHVRGVFQRFLNRENLAKTKRTTLSGVIGYFRADA